MASKSAGAGATATAPASAPAATIQFPTMYSPSLPALEHNRQFPYTQEIAAIEFKSYTADEIQQRYSGLGPSGVYNIEYRYVLKKINRMANNHADFIEPFFEHRILRIRLGEVYSNYRFCKITEIDWPGDHSTRIKLEGLDGTKLDLTVTSDPQFDTSYGILVNDRFVYSTEKMLLWRAAAQVGGAASGSGSTYRF